MNRRLILILILSMCFISGCGLKSDNKNGVKKSYMISEEKIKELFVGEKVVIEDFRNNKVKRVIYDKKEIEKILNILSHGVEEKGIVTSESCNWRFIISDNNDNSVATIWIWESGHFGLKNNKEYRFSHEEFKALKSIIDNI